MGSEAAIRILWYGTGKGMQRRRGAAAAARGQEAVLQRRGCAWPPGQGGRWIWVWLGRCCTRRALDPGGGRRGGRTFDGRGLREACSAMRAGGVLHGALRVCPSRRRRRQGWAKRRRAGAGRVAERAQREEQRSFTHLVGLAPEQVTSIFTLRREMCSCCLMLCNSQVSI